MQAWGIRVILKRNNIQIYTISIIVLLVTMVACGGGNESSGGTDTTKTGIFLDSPVSNMRYKTISANGVISSGATNAFGEFTYQFGDAIIFNIGDLEIAQSFSRINTAFVNIIRLLQSLDKDGISSNGITITEVAKVVATVLMFDDSVSGFKKNVNVNNLIMNAGKDTIVTKLVSASQALTHFNLSNNVIPTGGFAFEVINGEWVSAEGESIIFSPDSIYEQSSGELGSYSYTNNTLMLSSQITAGDGSGIFDDVVSREFYDGDINVSFVCDSSSTTMTLKGNSLVDNPLTVSVVRTDLVSMIVGEWKTDTGVTLTFDRSSYYKHSSGEIGSYTYKDSVLNITSHITNGDGTGGFDNSNNNGPVINNIQVNFSDANIMTLETGTNLYSYSRTASGHCLL